MGLSRDQEKAIFAGAGKNGKGIRRKQISTKTKVPTVKGIRFKSEPEKEDKFEYHGVAASYASPKDFYYEEFEVMPQEWIQIMDDDHIRLTDRTSDFLWQKNSGGWTVWEKGDYGGIKGVHVLSARDRKAITDYWNLKRREERGDDGQGFEKLSLEDYQKKEMAKFLSKPENKSQFDSLMSSLAKEGITPPK